MKTKLPIRLFAAIVLSLSSLLTIATPLVHATAQDCVWTGAAGNNTFSSATNWSSCNSSVPQSGDILVFNPAPSASGVNLTNDLGVSFGGIINNPAAFSSGTGQYTIDTLSLTSGATLTVGSTSDCTQYPQILNFSTLHAAGNLLVDDDGYDLSNSDLNLTVAGNLTLENSVGIGYMGTNTGSSVTGNLIIASPVDYHSGTCPSFSGGGGFTSGSSFSGFTFSGLVVQNGSSTALGDSSFPITLGGGTGTGNPKISFYPALDGDDNPVATTYTVTSPLTLTGNASLYASDQATVNLTSSISGSGFSLIADPNSEGTINFNPSSNNSNTATGVQQNPVQTITIDSTDSQPNMDETVITNETLSLDGERDDITVNRGGTLKGDGKLDGSVYVSPGAIIAPGHSPGCLTAADFVIAGTYQAEIGGTTPCSGYDQLKQTDTVSASDVTGATLAVSLYGGFAPAVGQTYTIIDNAGTTSTVTGTFAGLAEGATFSSQGVTYSISYKGGDGNDVVLTVTAVDAAALPAVPAKPDTGLALVAAHPMDSLIVSAIAAGSLYFMSRKVAKPSRR
jgi:hypothetical protein